MKLKRFWNNLKLRLALLRIWFLKNLTLFIKIICIICIICMFTGVIDEDTPILGKTIYIFFSPFVSEINKIIKERELNNLMNFLTIATSLLLSTGTFLLKVKNIAKDDIKSNKLKYALYKANMYFNEDGVLVKKIEKATNTDIDRDGKIDYKELTNEEKISNLKRKGFFSNIISSFKELNVILKADFTDNEKENAETYKNVLNEADLKEAEEAKKEIDEIVLVGKNNIVVDNATEIIEKQIDSTNADITLSDNEKVKKKSFLKDLREWVSSFKLKKREKKSKVEKEKPLDYDVITNNLENDMNNIKNNNEENIKDYNNIKQQPKIDNTALEFINSIKNRRK